MIRVKILKVRRPAGGATEIDTRTPSGKPLPF